MKFLILQTHDIGDVLISTALCDALKLAYPQAEIDFFSEDRCAGVVEGNPNVNEIILLNKSRRNSLRYVLGLLKYVRSKKYDCILNVQGQAVGLLICLFSRSSRRIGYNKLPWRLAHTDNVDLPWWLMAKTGHTDYPASQNKSGLGHTIDRRFNFLSLLSKDIKSQPFKLWLSESELAAGKDILISAGLDTGKPIIAFGINAQHSFKRWPIEHFAEIASWLITRYNVQLYVYFGPGEAAYTKKLKYLLPETKHHLIFDDVRTKSIRELAQVLHHCTLYVGNETGPRHIAQALNVPAFAVVSPSSNRWGWIPWDNPHYRAVDTGDALGISNTEWLAIRGKLSKGVNDAEWFERIKPDFVVVRLSAMIDELALFERVDDN